MKHYTLFLLALTLLISCTAEKISADLLVTNATIYTVDDSFGMAEAFVVKDGKILEIGDAVSISEKYKATETFDAGGNVVLPGLIDAHAHLLNLGVVRQQVDLVGATSYGELLERVVEFQKEKQSEFILGRGWDQNDWDVKEFPTKEALDSLFPDTPVALRRIDGHAMLCNSKALELAGITTETSMQGGEVIVENGEPTGVLIDMAMNPVGAIIPKKDVAFYAKALGDAEDICLSLGLTTVNDAGLSKEAIELIDSLQQSGEMKIRVYAMISNYPENLDHFLSKGIVKTDRLNVRSVKVYADGALGSRGAAMKEPYSDHPGHFGLMITTEPQMDSLAQRIAAAGYQMNTHAIGDSANVAVLRAYTKALEGKKDARWKVEHAQVIDLPDFKYFSSKKT